MHTGNREIKISQVIRTKSRATERLSECKCSIIVGGMSEGKRELYATPKWVTSASLRI